MKEYHEVDNPNIGYHHGYRYFKDRFHKIVVDNNKGTLYGFVDVEDYLRKLG